MLVDLLGRSVDDFLRHPDGAQTVHVRLGTVVGLILLRIAEVVVAVAWLARRNDADLADDRRVEVPHGLMQDGRNARGVDQVRQFLQAANVFAFRRVAQAFEGNFHQLGRDRAFQNDVAVAIQVAFLVESQCGCWDV